MEFQPSSIDYEVTALGMAWGIVKDIYAEADALIRDFTKSDQIDDWENQPIYLEIQSVFKEAAKSTQKLLPFFNDVQNEFRAAAMHDYSSEIGPKINLVASRCAAIAMAVLSQEDAAPDYKERAQNVLKQIGYFDPKGNHPYFR